MNTKRVWLWICLIALAVIFISSVGIAADKKAATKPSPAAKDAVAKPEEKEAESKTDLIDINTATKEQIKALEGIGDAYSQKIMTAGLMRKKTS